jgi:hypothetical protein
MDQDLLLFANQYDKEYEMVLYNEQHKAEKLKNYSYFSPPKNSSDLALQIYNNFDHMSEQEMRNIASQCLSIEQVKSILLSFEMENYIQKPVLKLSLDEFTEICLSKLNRYHWKAGGFLFEDYEWCVYKYGSLKYCVEENEVLFENTVDVSDMLDSNTEKYIVNLEKVLSSIAENITIDIRKKDNIKGKTIYILIWCTDQSYEDKVEIGL